MKTIIESNHPFDNVKKEKGNQAAALTIFTPSYNNGELIKKLYQTLQEQTCKDFEWMIIDDGSSDATREIVSGFQKNTDFPIRYFYTENKGKYMALYNAIQKCLTPLFCCIDADVALYKNIVEILLTGWREHFRGGGKHNWNWFANYI